jgi:hypothetical protein
LWASAAWEADAFGGLRREQQPRSPASPARWLAGAPHRRSEVACVALRASQQRRRVAEEQWRLQAETTSLVEARAAAGLDSDLDVARARALRDTIAARIPQFRLEEAVRRQQLGVLVAAPPSTLLAVVGDDGALPTLAPTPAGIPSELLQRRPDVQHAEATLTATARIGVASRPPEAAARRYRWPSGDGISALSLGAGNVFARRRSSRHSSVQGASAPTCAPQNAAQAVSAYQQAVRRDRERRALASDAYERAHSLPAVGRRQAVARLDAGAPSMPGVEDFLTVLDAERSALAAGRVIAAEQAVATATIAL